MDFTYSTLTTINNTIKLFITIFTWIDLIKIYTINFLSVKSLYSIYMEIKNM